MDDRPLGGNPYDFRSPVRSSSLLAGRSKELDQVDEFLRQSASGRPAHFSLFGSQGSGKSSLLNGVVDLARGRGFLAVKLALRKAIVATDLDFYKALYDVALQALLDDGRLQQGDPMMRAWLEQTCSGDPGSTPPEECLELGRLVAAKLLGRMVGPVPTPLVERDVRRLVSSGDTPLRGLVLCIDCAETIDDNRDLAPSIMELADATPLITIVTAAEGAGTLQTVAPRAWAQIEVGPFGTLHEILDAITKPVDRAEEVFGDRDPTPATAMDIQELTGGVPYEVSLVCHFVWDAIQHGEQEHFELSTGVIERLTAELEEKGRHQAGGVIAMLGELSESDYELLVKLAPFEALTVRDLALTRLMLDDYDDAGLEAAELAVRHELEQLQAKGVVEMEGDRFTLAGGTDGRLYLKYAARRQTGRELRYGDTYARSAATQCAKLAGDQITASQHNEARVFGSGRLLELGGTAVGGWINLLGEAAAGGDIATLAEHVCASLRVKRVLHNEAESFIMFGLQLQVGLHDVEHVDLLANVEGASIEDIRASIEEWVAEHGELLTKYSVRVVAWRCDEVPADVIRTALAYWQLRLVNQASYVIYRAGAIDAAEALLGEVLDVVAELVGPDPTDPLLRTQLAGTLHRRAFMAATRGAWDTARERLEQSRTTAITDEWLLDFNTAYVCAQEKDLAEAVELASSAVERYTPMADIMLLHAYFPAPAAWEPPAPQWNVVEIHGVWIKRFVELQLAVLEAALANGQGHGLESTLGELSSTAPAPLLRLAAWAYLTILGQARTAAGLFERAAAETRYNEPPMPTLELAFARSLVEDPPAT